MSVLYKSNVEAFLTLLYSNTASYLSCSIEDGLTICTGGPVGTAGAVEDDASADMV